MKKTLLKKVAATLAIALTLTTGATLISAPSTANASYYNYSNYELYYQNGRIAENLTHVRNIWKTCSSYNGSYTNTQLGIKLIVDNSYATGNNIEGQAVVINNETNDFEFTTVLFSKVNIPDEAGKSVYMGYIWAPEGSVGVLNIYNFNNPNDVINCSTKHLYF